MYVYTVLLYPDFLFWKCCMYVFLYVCVYNMLCTSLQHKHTSCSNQSQALDLLERLLGLLTVAQCRTDADIGDYMFITVQRTTTGLHTKVGGFSLSLTHSPSLPTSLPLPLPLSLPHIHTHTHTHTHHVYFHAGFNIPYILESCLLFLSR